MPNAFVFRITGTDLCYGVLLRTMGCCRARGLGVMEIFLNNDKSAVLDCVDNVALMGRRKCVSYCMIIHVNNIQQQCVLQTYLLQTSGNRVKKMFPLLTPFKAIFCCPPFFPVGFFFHKETIKLTATEVIVLGCLRVIHQPVVFCLILGHASWSVLLLCFST